MLTCHFCTMPVALSFCTAQSKHLTMNDTFTSMYVTNLGSTKTKQVSDRLEYITHLHQHTWSIHNSYTCPKCAYKISQIFSRVFEFALAEFARNPRKLMYHKYFCFYSNISSYIYYTWCYFVNVWNRCIKMTKYRISYKVWELLSKHSCKKLQLYGNIVRLL